MTTRRTRAREVALQLLFQWDQNERGMPRPSLEAFATDRMQRDDEGIAFCLKLYDGVRAEQKPIDALICETAENWKLHRMLPVDRNVLRLATYEMLFADPTTPITAAIDEAIELSRRFGSIDSPSFVNGILDRIAKKGHEPAVESQANA